MKERKTVLYAILTVVGIIIIISVKAQMNENWYYTWEPPYSSYEQQVLLVGFIGIAMLASGAVGLLNVLRQSKQEQEMEQRTGGVKNCPNCGLSISGHVKICPRCGVDILTGVLKTSTQNTPIQNSPRQDITAQNLSTSAVLIQNVPDQKVSAQSPEEETVVLGAAPKKMEQKVPENQVIRFCTKCGNRVDRDDLFCASCGNKIKRGKGA